jgi:hypothetical protein
MSSDTLAVGDTCTAEEIPRAADGFDHLGLSELADLTRRPVDADFREQRGNRASHRLKIGLLPNPPAGDARPARAAHPGQLRAPREQVGRNTDGRRVPTHFGRSASR